MKRLLLFILFLLLFITVKAQGWQDTVTTINSFFDRYLPDRPGCQLAISRDDKIIYSKAWGLADIERNVPYTTATVTEAGSISKEFTAAAILLLEKQGKLSLTDDVRKYLPELPNYRPVIRIEHLLHHTSGIREWSDLAAMTGWPRTTRAYTNDDVFSFLCKQEKLNNVPGTEYIYSNSNYLLLAMVVERVSGLTLPDFTKQYIFEPAGMVHTCWRDDFKKVVLNRGIAYWKTDNYYKINMPTESVYGPGGLLTTTDDLVKWAGFYLSGRLGGPGLLNKQLAIKKLTEAGETRYAAGLVIDSLNGVQRVSHTGQTASYVGIVVNFPALKLSIAWLSNTSEFKSNLFDGVKKIEDLFVQDKAGGTPEKDKNGRKVVPVGKIKKYAGWYRFAKTNQGIIIALKNDTLFFDGTPLFPISLTDFKYKESMVKFDFLNGFTLLPTDKRRLRFTKEKPAEITTAYLKAFTGTYYSKETDSHFSVILKEGKLFIGQNYLKDVVLLPTYKNGFNFYLSVDSNLNPILTNALFERSKTGNVFTCHISMSDARGIRFEKIK
jgi:CubicO group peptidase (beta-lactamase class C family)